MTAASETLDPASPRRVLVTGASGYLGRPLVEALLRRGHQVSGLVRSGSEHKLPPGCAPVVGDALVASTYARAVPPGGVLVHLVGVARPSPRKAKAFREIDLCSIAQAAESARAARVARLVYVSVAHPAPVMKAYVAARRAGEALVREVGCPTSILRPWYVLGPGHRWPWLLAPLYALASLIPGLRAGARRLGLVRRHQMIRALVAEVECETPGSRISGVQEIRNAVL